MSTVLEVQGLTKDFGAVRAVNLVDLTIAEGEVCAIIGPNGAGKTTVFNMLTGAFPATRGHVRFAGRDISRFPPERRNHAGIARSFQITNIFQGLDVFENVRLACQGATPGLFGTWFARKEEEAWAILRDVGLLELADVTAGNLSHGDQRYLEIALALAAAPRLLMLDEPTSGMTPLETRQTIALLRNLKTARPQLAVLLIEHDMEVVKDLSDRIYVLDFGSVIAQGRFAELKSNPQVIKAYFGAEE
ncbi:MAG: ABC transporter ATP-binding protein [Candidatus Lambdaproteobacteria bacterium]|nr:ABC transporter ATP-binding protein [Candidatus Lambdaproteobacteria bacterium]